MATLVVTGRGPGPKNHEEFCAAMPCWKQQLPQLPQVRGGMSGQQQQERMHVTERQ